MMPAHKSLSPEPASDKALHIKKNAPRNKSEHCLYWCSAQERLPLIGQVGIITKSAQHFPVMTLSATALTSHTFTAGHETSPLDPDPSTNSYSRNTIRIYSVVRMTILQKKKLFFLPAIYTLWITPVKIVNKKTFCIEILQQTENT